MACSSGTREGGARSSEADSGVGSGLVDAEGRGDGGWLDDADAGGPTLDGTTGGTNEAAVTTDGGNDDALIVPEGLTVTPLPGGNGVLDLVALTLRKDASGTGLYAALRNDDATIDACDPSLSVELYDKGRQSMGMWLGALMTKHFYEVVEAGTVASCVGPGDVTMAALTDLPADLVIDDVAYIVYRCSYFNLDVVPINGLAISQVASVAGDGGTAFKGTLVNGFDAAVTSPSIAVFPVSPVGRPVGVGVATSGDAGDIPAGGSWDFQTSTVDVPVIQFVAYPTAEVIQ
jgi:hypothetical protein